MSVGLTPELIADRLELAEELLAARASGMFEPQDLPGRYGRVVRAIDHVLQSMACEALVGGGWAVWRHGYLGRVTQDVDIVLPQERIAEFLRVAGVSGFDVLPCPPGRWPKVRHKETDITVDILPEGGRPGTPARPAPTTIRNPAEMGAVVGRLTYIDLPSLVELKLAAGRVRDEADVIELIRANPAEVPALRRHLAQVHERYAAAFDALVRRADEQEDR